jgi:DNA-binding IscR family transcriptional regulator
MLADIWQDFSDLIDTFLSRITIKDIVEKGGKKLSESVDSDHDFSI